MPATSGTSATESSGPTCRLCDAVPASYRAGAARRDGPGVPQAAFNKLTLNFTWWVNRKDRSARTCSRRLPGPRQYRVFRPKQRAATAAHRRPSRAGGRHRLDGAVRQNAGTRGGTRRHDPAYEDMVLKFTEHFLLHRSGHDRPGSTACGTRRTVSTTTCCGCRTATPPGSRCARCGAAAAVRHVDRRGVAARAQSPRHMAALMTRLGRMPE